MGIIQRLFSRLLFRRGGKKSSLVGKDEYGNKYYELMPSNSNELPSRSKRWMEPPFNNKEYDVDKVPASWRSWLAHQRTTLPE